MQDSNYFSNLARRCRDLGKTAIEAEVIEQLRIWATELAEIAENSESGPVEHAEDKDRLFPCAVDQPEPIDSLDHLGVARLLDHRLDAPVRVDGTLTWHRPPSRIV
jgi:hypothetical protein